MKEVRFTKISTKGQIVIPQEIRKDLQIKSGTPFMVVVGKDTILLKRMELPRVKKWSEVTRPFRDAVKESKFTKKDLERLIKSVRLKK